MLREIIIMAKSFKHYNFCIAGIDNQTGEWIRLVSSNEELEGAVLVEDATYNDGVQAEVLDVVRVDVLNRAPTRAQCENYLYNSEYAWKKIGHVSFQEVLDRFGLSRCDKVFVNNNKFLNEDELDGTSLLLLKVDNPKVVVKTFPNKKSVSLIFNYNGMRYAFFSISDIPVYKRFKVAEDGTYEAFGDSCYVLFSLTGRFSEDGKYYKMAANFFV